MNTFGSTTHPIAAAHGTATPNPVGIYIAIGLTITLAVLGWWLHRRVINTPRRRIAAFVIAATAAGLLLPANLAGTYAAIIVTIALGVLWRWLSRSIINTRGRRIAAFVITAAALGMLVAVTTH